VKSLGLYYRLSGELLPLFKRLGSRFFPKNNRFLHRVEKVRLVAARDQAIVELRQEKLQKEAAEKAHRVARVRRQILGQTVYILEPLHLKDIFTPIWSGP